MISRTIDRSLFLGFTTCKILGRFYEGSFESYSGERSWYRSCDILSPGYQLRTRGADLAARKWPFMTNGKEEKRETTKSEKNKAPLKFVNPDFAFSFFFGG